MADAGWSRLELARGICSRLEERHPGALLLGGVYGSTARGTDTPWSDLELFLVARDGCGFPGAQRLFRGTAVACEVVEEAALRSALAAPTASWPMRMGVLSTLRVLTGDPELVREWLSLGRTVPSAAFRAALAREAPGLVVESHGRMHSSLVRGDVDTVHVSAIEVLLEMRTGLCLLNGRWVTRDYLAGILEAAAFPLVPEGYASGAAALWRETDPLRAVALADALVAGWWRLLAQEGVAVRDALTLDELLAP